MFNNFPIDATGMLVLACAYLVVNDPFDALEVLNTVRDVRNLESYTSYGWLADNPGVVGELLLLEEAKSLYDSTGNILDSLKLDIGVSPLYRKNGGFKQDFSFARDPAGKIGSLTN